MFPDPTEISVTEEMEKVGRTTLLSHGKTVGDMYRAMAGVAPKDGVVVLRGWLDAMTEQRDAALARAEAAEADLANHWGHFQDWHARALAAEQRLAALEPKTELTHDWTREFPADRRRVGG